MNAYAKCSESQAQLDPNSLCIDTVNEYGQFALFSDQTKADVCARAVDKYRTLQAQSISSGQG